VRGHGVDDCDLNAEGFDPVMTEEDRLGYYDIPENRRRVGPHVERLLKSDALIFSFPVWNMGFPAILKGFVDKVFLPGVSFNLKDDGAYVPCLNNVKKLGRGVHLWRRPLDDLLDGRPAAAISPAIDALELRAGRALRLPRLLRHGSHDA
jgi:putative NADPH-quinone reductase